MAILYHYINVAYECFKNLENHGKLTSGTLRNDKIEALVSWIS